MYKESIAEQLSPGANGTTSGKFLILALFNVGT
jgi:hypothetical protein